MAAQPCEWEGPRRAGGRGRPVYPPPRPPGLSPVLERNIQALKLGAGGKKRRRAPRSGSRRRSPASPAACGSSTCTSPSSASGSWPISAGSGGPQMDPSFVVLAMVASVEAIFLSTFVLISQNRLAAAADKRADLDLQISLLAEHEVTRLVTLVADIANRMG